MGDLLRDPQFWKVVSGLAWPAVILSIFLVLRKPLLLLLSQKGVTIRVAGFEIAVAEVAKTNGEQIVDLQKKISEIESVIVRGEVENIPIRSERSLARPIELLWVDDSPSNNAFLIEKFKSEGVNVETAVSTSQALSYISAKKPDIIISDLGRNEDGAFNPNAGFDLLNVLRKMNFNIPTMIFASRRAMESKDRLLAAGAQRVSSSGGDVISFVESHLK